MIEMKWEKQRSRSRIEIYVDILKAINDKRKKTHIVYKCNLNFSRVKQYMNELYGYGLIKITANSPSTWAVTEKGYKFLREIQRTYKFLRETGIVSQSRSG